MLPEHFWSNEDGQEFGHRFRKEIGERHYLDEVVEVPENKQKFINTNNVLEISRQEAVDVEVSSLRVSDFNTG